MADPITYRARGNEPAIHELPTIVIPVGRCDWCHHEAIHRVGPYVACMAHADQRHPPERTVPDA